MGTAFDQSFQNLWDPYHPFLKCKIWKELGFKEKIYYYFIYNN